MRDNLPSMLRSAAREWCEANKNVRTFETRYDAALEEAAEAIEELSREVEEYKAAYRKEHNKRIAENRYLYDELTKAVRAKLLMTPMRIEVPQPPKEVDT